MRKILLVDDTPETISLFAALLTRDGYECMTVDDGWPAITAAAIFDPDVILMDIEMPGLDGYSAAQVIRTQERRRSCWIIAVSGKLDLPAVGALDDPFDARLVKPVSYTALRKFVSTLPETNERKSSISKYDYRADPAPFEPTEPAGSW